MIMDKIGDGDAVIRNACKGCKYHYTQRWCFNLYLLDKCKLDWKVKGFTNIIFTKITRGCSSYVLMAHDVEEDVEEVDQQ